MKRVTATDKITYRIERGCGEQDCCCYIVGNLQLLSVAVGNRIVVVILLVIYSLEMAATFVHEVGDCNR